MVLSQVVDAFRSPHKYEFEPYAALGDHQIRVLTLQRHSHGPVISGNLKTIDIAPSPADSHALATVDGGFQPRPYHALSYATGSQKKRVQFRCDGRIFSIPRSLWQGLVRIAELDLHCPIWVDNVCINQRNEDEKHRQIESMSNVYRSARQIWIWLGSETDETRVAMREIPRINDSLLRIDARSYAGNGVLDRYKRFDLPKPESRVWYGIANLLKRAYWDRLWTLQEAVLARKKVFLCGPDTLPWEQLQDLCTSFERLGLVHVIRSKHKTTAEGNIDAFESFSHAERCAQGAAITNDRHWSLLKIAMKRTCSHSQDRVLAVLGLLNQEQRMQLDLSAGSAKLYPQFAQLMITEHNLPELIKMAYLYDKSRNRALPTWCPDFHARVNTDHLPFAAVTGFAWDSKLGDMSADPAHSRAHTGPWYQIKVFGRCLGTVSKVTFGRWTERVRPGSRLDESAAWNGQAWETSAREVALGSFDRARSAKRRKYLRTITGRTKLRLEPTVSGEHFSTWWYGLEPHHKSTDPDDQYDRYREILKLMANPGTDSEGRRNTPPAASDMLSAISRMCTDRSLFRTKTGRFGLGPTGLRPRDKICFLGDKQALVVLRPNMPSRLKGHKPVFHLVGEAYVDELLPGKYNKPLLPSDERLWTFTLE